jgi:hypothetical protein
MLRPLLPVALLIATLAGGLRYAESQIVYSDYNGRPLDHPGSTAPCTQCPEPLARNVRGYHYRCDRCGIAFQCRLREDGRFRYNPDLRPR